MTENAIVKTQDPTPNVASWASPPVDIYENKEGFIILAELPGVAKADVQLEFQDEELQLRATRPAEGPAQEEQVSLHALRRSLRLPGVDGDQLSATLQDGLLTVHAPKLAPPGARSIPLA